MAGGIKTAEKIKVADQLTLKLDYPGISEQAHCNHKGRREWCMEEGGRRVNVRGMCCDKDLTSHC